MQKKIQITPIPVQTAAVPKSGSFSRTFLAPAETLEVYSLRGDLYLLCTFAHPLPDFDFEEEANHFLNKFSLNYFNRLDGSITEALQQTFVQTLPEKPLSLNAVAAVIWGEIVLFGSSQGGWAALLREGDLKVFEPELFPQEVLKDGDLLVLMTPGFIEEIGYEQLRKILLEYKEEELVSRLREEISQKPDQAKLALLLLKVAISRIPALEEKIEILEPISQPAKHRLSDYAALVWSIFVRFAANLRSRTMSLLARSEPTLYLKERTVSSPPPKNLLIGLFIFLLALAIWGSHKYNSYQKEKQLAQQLVNETESKIKEGQEIAAFNPERAKDLFKEAVDNLGKVKGLRVDKRKVTGLEGQLKEVFEQAYRSQKIQAKETSQSLTAEPYRFVAGQGILDREDAVLIKPDSRWQNSVTLAAYGGNIYLLDKNSSQIWKYLAIEGGFSKAFEYFKEPTDLSEVLDFAIDSNIFLLFQKGRLQKYLAGKRTEFTLSGLYPDLTRVSKIVTAAELTKLYLIDNSTILVFDKNGVYEKRWIIENIASIESLQVDEKAKQGLILSGGKTYEFNLQ